MSRRHLLTFWQSSSVSPDNPDHSAILHSVLDEALADLVAVAQEHAALLELEPVVERVVAAWQEEDAVVEVDTSNVAVAVVAVEEVRIACVAPQERPVLAPFVVVAVQEQ